MQHSAAATLPRRSAAPPCASPLAGLAGSDLSRRFRHWRGASGRRHLFSVFPLGGIAGGDPSRPASAPASSEAAPGDDAPRFADAVVMAVGRDAAGLSRILALDETGPLPDRFYDSAAFRRAVAAGADEIHVHLLADGPAARAAVRRDLAGM